MNSRKGRGRGRVELMGGNENDRSRPRKLENFCKRPYVTRGTRRTDARC